MKIRLSQWARENSMSYSGAYNLFKQGKLPVRAEQLKSGTILVEAGGATTSCKVLDKDTGRSFSIEWDMDINSCGLHGDTQRDILDQMDSLTDCISKSLGFGVNIEKIWRP